MVGFFGNKQFDPLFHSMHRTPIVSMFSTVNNTDLYIIIWQQILLKTNRIHIIISVHIIE